jgi:mRNA (guanine-N7-)-methyltransferase
MSCYPTTQPRNKHDILCNDSTDSLSSIKPQLEVFNTLVERIKFTSSDQFFRAVDETPPTSNDPIQIASVYSYDDGPKFPGPLSRRLLILGTAERSLSVVREIIDCKGNDLALPDGLHQCTLAVQRADAGRYDQLEERHQHNSTQFAIFMTALRQQDAVAILGKDKYGRFGVLAPIAKENYDGYNNTSDKYTANDFAATCFIGHVKELKNILSGCTASSIAEQEATNPWESNQDMGPMFKSVDDTVDRRDCDGGWKPTTPPVPPDNDGAGTNGFFAPWSTSAGDHDNTGSSSMPWENIEEPEVETNKDSASAAMPWETQIEEDSNVTNRLPWETDAIDTSSNNKRSFDAMNGGNEEDNHDGAFHKNKGAAEADAFYSGLTRSLETRADSYLYHMRSFNGWVKATQIAELDPVIVVNGKVQPKQPLRVLDLACGKGGDLTKWTLHTRGMKHYVGIDVARGSLKDAAERARGMRQKKKLDHAIFSCADLGSDVPGRKKTPKSKRLQKLLTWRLHDEALYESGSPEFKMERGGGISESDKFDVVSIQFAIHYMMQTGDRARRFFHTVSQLLEIGGLLAFTTIDARVIIDHMMNLGLDYHFETCQEPNFSEVVVEAGAGACKLKFEPNIVKKMLQAQSVGTQGEEELFGLEYTFTLVEGSNHAAGVGDAVNLPEWLIPIPVLVSLGKEAGLEIDYVQNFHEFYNCRNDPNEHAAAHTALYNMKVVNRNGTISKDEWSVSRLYAAMRFRKVRESSIVMDDINLEGDDDDETDDKCAPLNAEPVTEIRLDPEKIKKMYPLAMMKAKKAAGHQWNTLSREEKEELTQRQLRTSAVL